MCNRHNVVLIPFGGGTSVTGALLCPEQEKRMIVSLDTSQMVSLNIIINILLNIIRKNKNIIM